MVVRFSKRGQRLRRDKNSRLLQRQVVGESDELLWENCVEEGDDTSLHNRLHNVDRGVRPHEEVPGLVGEGKLVARVQDLVGGGEWRMPTNWLHPRRPVGRVAVCLQITNPQAHACGEEIASCFSAKLVETSDAAPALFQQTHSDHIIAEDKESLPEVSRITSSPLNG